MTFFDLQLTALGPDPEPDEHRRRELAATNAAIAYSRRNDCDVHELLEPLFAPTREPESDDQRYRRNRKEREA